MVAVAIGGLAVRRPTSGCPTCSGRRPSAGDRAERSSGTPHSMLLTVHIHVICSALVHCILYTYSTEHRNASTALTSTKREETQVSVLAGVIARGRVVRRAVPDRIRVPSRSTQLHSECSRCFGNRRRWCGCGQRLVRALASVRWLSAYAHQSAFSQRSRGRELSGGEQVWRDFPLSTLRSTRGTAPMRAFWCTLEGGRRGFRECSRLPVCSSCSARAHESATTTRARARQTRRCLDQPKEHLNCLHSHSE